MTEAQVLALASQAMLTGAKIAAPVMIAGMAVGLIVSLLQSVTQIQEQTLTFVPKVITISLVLLAAGHWMIGTFTAYVHALFSSVPSLLAGG